MKYVSLSVSVALTILVWSFSFQTGETSAALSSDVTISVYQFLESVFPRLDIDLDQLHVVIRKTAHVTEYMILAFAWIITAIKFGLHRFTGTLAALGVAFIDEGIQMFTEGRGPSFIDVFVFDLSGILIAFGLVLLFTKIQKRRRMMRMTSNILTRVNQQKIKPAKAYKTLYEKRSVKKMKKMKRAHFIKIKIVTDDKTANRFLGFFLWMPIPICFLSVFKRSMRKKELEDVPISVDEMFDMIRYKGIKIDVKSQDGSIVKIKTI